jgi:hypothetical protein
MTDAQSFVDSWSRVWRGRDSDPQLYMSLLHQGCVLINPLSAGTREDLPKIVEAFLAVEPDIRVVPTRWGETADGVLIEWVNTGTLHGAPFELRGADRFTLATARHPRAIPISTLGRSSKGRRRRPTGRERLEMSSRGPSTTSWPRPVRSRRSTWRVDTGGRTEPSSYSR